MIPDTPSTSTAPTPPKGEKHPPIPELISQLWQLIVTYLKQETVIPLKNLGRYLGFGIGGALLIASGIGIISIGVLRGTQVLLDTEPGGDHSGDWVSAMPYFITIGFLIVVAALVFFIGTRKKKGTA